MKSASQVSCLIVGSNLIPLNVAAAAAAHANAAAVGLFAELLFKQTHLMFAFSRTFITYFYFY